jgi:hypothetical protein
MKKEELEAIKRRCEAATAIPEYTDDCSWWDIYKEPSAENKEFLLHARNDILYLLKELENHKNVADSCTRQYGNMEREIERLRHDVNVALGTKIAGHAALVTEVERLRGLLRDVGNTLVETGILFLRRLSELL